MQSYAHFPQVIMIKNVFPQRHSLDFPQTYNTMTLNQPAPIWIM